jgi:hypothetical protein
MYIYIYISIYIYIYLYKYTESRPNGKLQLLFVCCKRKTKITFATNRNGKRRFVFLGQQTINGNR